MARGGAFLFAVLTAYGEISARAVKKAVAGLGRPMASGQIWLPSIGIDCKNADAACAGIAIAVSNDGKLVMSG